jgi:hypothetical protein
MSEDLRLAEPVAGLSLATDLGMGQRLEQALGTCLIGLALSERLELISCGINTQDCSAVS